jgi:hypothetical protein
MTSMYNKLCNKQNGLFSSNMSYLQKGQKSSNEFFKTYKPLNSSNSTCFMANFSFSILFYNVNNSFKGFHKLQGYFKFI